MGIALLVAAGFLFAKVTRLMPSADVGTLDLQGAELALGLVGSFFLGAIMPLGIGYYAPCMILVNLLGMNPLAAFPIMMGACAFLMPVASLKFIRTRRYSLRTTIGMAIGGIFGSALALIVVKSLPLYYVMWLVTLVVIYTGVSLLRAASSDRRSARQRLAVTAIVFITSGLLRQARSRTSPFGDVAACLERPAGGRHQIVHQHVVVPPALVVARDAVEYVEDGADLHLEPGLFPISRSSPSVSVSPASTPPPGTLHRPASGAKRRLMRPGRRPAWQRNRLLRSVVARAEPGCTPPTPTWDASDSVLDSSSRFPHHLDDHPLPPLAVELGVEDLLPRAEVELAVGDRQDHLVAHDACASDARRRCPRRSGGGGSRPGGRELLEPLPDVLDEAALPSRSRRRRR